MKFVSLLFDRVYKVKMKFFEPFIEESLLEIVYVGKQSLIKDIVVRKHYKKHIYFIYQDVSMAVSICYQLMMMVV